MMTTTQYIDSINGRYKLVKATEHTFRGTLTQLIESLVRDIKVTHEPKRQKCGAPDDILSKGEIEVGYIEAKDIADTDLEGKKKNKEQFDRSRMVYGHSEWMICYQKIIVALTETDRLMKAIVKIEIE